MASKGIVANKYLSIVIILAFPHPRIKHLLIVAIRVSVVINPVVYSLSLCEPFFIMLVKLALLYILVQLDIVSFPQNSQHLVVNLSYPFVRVFY